MEQAQVIRMLRLYSAVRNANNWFDDRFLHLEVDIYE